MANIGTGNMGMNREMSESTYDTFSDRNGAPQQDAVAALHVLCDNAKHDDLESWNAIREWIERNGNDEGLLVAAAQTLGEYATTPLHLACRNCPPVDIVQTLLDIAPETVELTDSFSWLPLHYACAHGASEDVLRILADAFPDSKIAQDKRGRTPLHFALGNTKQPACSEAVELLASSGAASRVDENGMLPLHYACAYGICQEALGVLTSIFPEAIAVIDNKGRTPLHFAMGNAHRDASPGVVDILLSHNRDVVNLTDKEGQLPLQLLSVQAQKLAPEKKKERLNAQKCLKLYLKAEPKATADFFIALQALPEFLREHAVVTPHVQSVLNAKVSKRFHTMVKFLDLYFTIVIVISFRFAVFESIMLRYNEDYKENHPDAMVPSHFLGILFLGGSYFLLRELIQMMSLAVQGQFRDWVFDGNNVLDVIFILVVFFNAIVMKLNAITSGEFFRTFTAFSTLILWMKVLFFLKSIFVDFAVFVGGVFYVVRRLVTFLISLLVILVMFAQMFFTVFQETEECQTPNEIDHPPWCVFWFSLLKVYTMLLGEIDMNDFIANPGSIVLFIFFMLLVVILLANVLIAIVTDSYGVIQNERAQVVFWNNMLDTIAEMHILSSGPWTYKIKGLCCGVCTDGDSATADTQNESGDKEVFGRNLWTQSLEIYNDQSLTNMLTREFWVYLFVRVFAAFAIPIWLLLGLFPFAGLLWPPQVREFLFVQKTSRNQSDSVVEQRSIQMDEIKNDVCKLQNNIDEEMETDKQEVDEMKSQLVQMKAEMKNEMNQIKELMTMLFDVQTS